jgi:predicted small secreted protein
MKKLFMVAALLIALVFAGCNTGTGSDTDAGGATRFKIGNLSSFNLETVYWQGVEFYVDEGGTYDGEYYPSCLTRGNSVTQTVQANSGYIYFSHGEHVGGTGIDARTQDFVVVEEKQTAEFTFTDNTVVVEVGNTSNTGSLGSILSAQ